MARTLAALALLAAGAFPNTAHAQDADPSEDARTVLHMRVTAYLESGVMASGEYTRPGAAACSNRFPFGTQFELPSGDLFTCLDRGLGDRYWPGVWIDLWRRTDLVHAYGDWQDVAVNRWGWDD